MAFYPRTVYPTQVSQRSSDDDEQGEWCSPLEVSDEEGLRDRAPCSTPDLGKKNSSGLHTHTHTHQRLGHITCMGFAFLQGSFFSQTGCVWSPHSLSSPVRDPALIFGSSPYLLYPDMTAFCGASLRNSRHQQQVPVACSFSITFLTRRMCFFRHTKLLRGSEAQHVSKGMS